MSYKIIHRLIAAAVLIISAIQFLLTAQPSVSFWDPGEISAAAYALQVPHPPGGPLFSLVGRVFYMLPLPGNIGFRMNLVSVVSSAFAVLFAYLCAVRLIEMYAGRKPQNNSEALGTYFSAAIGALALSFCDTFWFNGVESNMFAGATFLVALVAWLMLRWHEESGSPDGWRYILLIAYVIGLSTGVHLMSILVIVPVVMMVVLRRFAADENLRKQSAYIFLAHGALLLIAAIALWSTQTSQEPPDYDEFGKFDLNFLMIMGAISLVIIVIFRKKIFRMDSFYAPILFAGIALGLTFAGIYRRLPKLLGLVAGDNIVISLIVLALILGGLMYGVHWLRKNQKNILAVAALSIVLIILGYTTYTEVIIRANAHPPMNEDNPSSFTRLVTYLGREQYGDWPLFKRRWSGESQHQTTWTNYSSDLDFFWRYQMNHMFTRYLLWNFAGRESFIQEAGVNWKQLYGIPFLVGLFGMLYHFRRDWKTASVFVALFLFMGYLIAFYPNAQEAQPRERDYFYAGAFFVFALWIAVGLRGILDLIGQRISAPRQAAGASAAVLLLAAVFIPARMFQANYFTHDRSKNWLPWDFAYNLLQSCAPDAILITAGDNDTFPLWYLQDVEGVRRDVRIANLSLANTAWYVKQLRDETPYGTKKINMRFTDEQIDKLEPVQWTAKTISVPVPPNAIKAYHVTDTSVINRGAISFTLAPTEQFGDVGAIRVQDLVVREIVTQNAWDRPIYFANTCGTDPEIGLTDYIRIEGLAGRLVPQKNPFLSTRQYYLNDTLLQKNLLGEHRPPDTSYQPGFLYRGLNDTTVFYDENQMRMAESYQDMFMVLAAHYLYGANDKALCHATLDRMLATISTKVLPLSYRTEYNVAVMYDGTGDTVRYRALAQKVEQKVLAELNNAASDSEELDNMNGILVQIYERTGQFNKALEILERLAMKYPNDSNLRNELGHFKQLASQQKK